MSDTNIKEILTSRMNDLKSGNNNYREIFTCSHITIRGVQCQNKCFMRPGDVKPKCHSHLKCIDVVQCAHIHKDENGEDIQCEKLSRSKTGFCNFHASTIINRNSAKEYYKRNAEKIKQNNRDVNLIMRLDKLITKVNKVLANE